MNNLNTVLPNGTFGVAVGTINANFSLIVNAINSLEYASTKSKGIHNYGFVPSATTIPNAVSGDWCMVLREGNTFPADIWTYNGTSWSKGGAWTPEGIDLTDYATKTELTTAITDSLAKATARMGYGVATASGNDYSVTITNYTLPANGGIVRVKMPTAATGAATLDITDTGAKTLWYNGAAVSSQNTWEAGEIISVFYDGTKYMASNSQGGGGGNGKKKLTGTSGFISTGNVDTQGVVPTPIANINYVHIKYGVNKGDVLLLTAKGSNTVNGRIWAFADANNNYTEGAEISDIAENMLLIIPDGVKWVILNNNINTCPEYEWYFAKKGSTAADALLSKYAEYIKYDNSQSGFAANNVQGALDELYNALGNKVEWDSLPIGIGHPKSDSAQWAVSTVEQGGITYYRYHRLIKRYNATLVKVDANNGNDTKYYFLASYTTPSKDSYVDYCNGYSQVFVVPAGSTSGWVEIPSDCEYIVIQESNAYINLTPKAVYLDAPDASQYKSRRVAIPADMFTQGGISSQNGADTTNTIRIRTQYLSVRKGDIINVKFNNQCVAVYEYGANKEYTSNSAAFLLCQKYVCTKDGFVKILVAAKNKVDNISIDDLTAEIAMPIKSDVLSLNNDAGNLLSTLKRSPRVNNVIQANVLSLLHFSDLHIIREFELKRIIRFYNQYNGLIDDILFTGDLQDDGWESGIDYFVNTDGSENILQAIGNHDCVTNAPNRVMKPRTDVYNRFFAPFVSNWGVTQPSDAASNGLMYYYKDYTGAKIRLIGIDCMYWDSAQKIWLQNTLASVPSDYSVICAVHYKPYMTSADYLDCNMSDWKLQPGTVNEQQHTLNAEAILAVGEFITNGGKFICWLAGHEHKDYVGVAHDDQRQLVIGIALAQCGYRDVYGVMDRVEGTKSQDLFNVVGFDTFNKYIRIIRFGADFDSFMRSKKSCCISYDTKEIISES